MISAPSPEPVRRRAELLVWSLPALLVGAWVRFELLRGWQAGFYFGPDSGSYWETAFRFSAGGEFDVSSKRPWLYPVLVWLASHGPVSPAFSVALLQQACSWLSIAALGGIVRAVVPGWKWFIIPATVLYAAHPEILYWNHVLIADSFFISLTVVVTLAAVIYWQRPTWRWLVVLLALLFLSMALRPVGRALWLTCIPLALLVPQIAWRQRFAHAAALGILYLPASAATAVNQGEDLLFASTLPLIRLDTPLHADLKAELRPQIVAARADLWSYVTLGQRQVWGDLIDDDPADADSVLQRLRADRKRYREVRREISREALRSHPWDYVRMIAMKVFAVFAINDAHERLQIERWTSANEKFLGRTFQKIDPGFPAWVLRDSAITDEATLHASFARTLEHASSRARAEQTLAVATRATTPFELRGAWSDRWWWIACVLLGVGLAPWVRSGHRLWPVLLLAAGYLALTFLVGRAVGRYRLPVEFALYVTACAGLAAVPQLFRKRVEK